MTAILRCNSRLLPTRSLPALLGFLVLTGCSALESECGEQLFGPGAQYNAKLDIIEAPLSEPADLEEWKFYDNSPVRKQLLDMTNQQALDTLVTPVDQATASPSRGGGSVASHAVRAAIPATFVVYVLDKFGGLLRFDPEAKKFVATLDFSQVISLGIAQRFAVTPDYKFAFITVNSTTAQSAGYVLVADLTKFSIVSTVPLPAGMLGSGIAITPDGGRAYVVARPLSGTGPSNVYVLDVAARQITATIPVAGYSGLGQIAIASDGTAAYLINNIAESGFFIAVLDLQSNTVQPAIPVFPSYTQSYMALHPDGTRIYLAPILGGPVMVVNTVTRLTSTISLAAGSKPVFGSVPVFTPDGIHLVFTSGATSVVLVNTLTDTVESTITLRATKFGEVPYIGMFFVPNP